MVLDHLLFPLRCPACELTSRSLCRFCRDELEPWEAHHCLRCGAASAEDCLCRRLPPAMAWCRSLWRFDGPVVDVIETAKYRGELWRFQALKREIVGWLGAQLVEVDGPVEAVPVPPSPRRFRRRGFDLPLIVARWLSRWPEASLARRVLVRVRDAGSQAGLDREARLRNVAGTFRARSAPRRVLLVDDVITTGATVCACAQSLADAGVEWIGVVAVARTMRE